jgi:hypothetical protein
MNKNPMKSKYIQSALIIALFLVVGFFIFATTRNNSDSTEAENSVIANTDPNDQNVTDANPPTNQTAPPPTPQGWKKFLDSDTDLSFSYPSYLSPVGTLSTNSVLGTYDDTIKGLHAGTHVLVVAHTQAEAQNAKSYFNEYYSQALATKAAAEQFLANASGPAAACYKGATTNAGLKTVYCIGEGGAAFYGLLEQNSQTLFIDGYSQGYGTNDAFVSFKTDADFQNFLNSISFTK